MSEILNDTNFDQFIQDNENVMVDFFAEWCGPCKMLGPIIDEIAEELKDQNVKIVKLNVEESLQTAQKFKVMSIPTIIYFKKGEVKETTMGLMSKNELKEKIDNLINS
jgi:thioredoxin 1